MLYEDGIEIPIISNVQHEKNTRVDAHLVGIGKKINCN